VGSALVPEIVDVIAQLTVSVLTGMVMEKSEPT
jgi:hypothetical protein